MRLKNKVAIITGASRSIGKAVALRFALEGAKIIVNYNTNAELADGVVNEIRENGGIGMAVKADVSCEVQVSELVNETLSKYGKIDILVNNAAIDPRKKWNEITVDEWDRVMNVNVRSQFICSKSVYPSMRDQGKGKIINVSSVTFWTGQKNYVHYVASKGAIIGFTRALSRELGSNNISVNCISLGAILTETEIEKLGSIKIQKDVSKKLIEFQSLPFRLTSKDIEGAFIFFASSDSDFITGQTLIVDGGWIMH